MVSRNTAGWRGPVSDYYPLWKHSFFGWLVPALLVATLTVLGVVYGKAEDPVLASVILVLAGSGVVILCGAGLLTQLWARYSVLSHVLVARDYGGCPDMPTVCCTSSRMPIAFRIEPYLDLDDSLHAYTLCNRIVDEAGFVSALTKGFKDWGPTEYNYRWCQPIVFVTIKSPGRVTFWDGFAKILRRARGLQRGNWVEVEWLGEEATRKLILHELAHVICSASGWGTTDAQQHKVMEDALVKEAGV